MADKPSIVRKPWFRIDSCPARKGKPKPLLNHQQPKQDSIINSNRRCRELECQKITEKLQCSLAKDGDEKAHWFIGRQLQDALLNYHMVMDFGQTIDNGRWSFISKESASEISTKTAGQIVSCLFQSMNRFKNKPRTSGTCAVKAELSLVNDSGNFSWDHLFRNVCCLVAHLGYRESDFTQRLRQHSTSGSSSTLVFDMTRDQVELCIGLLSEQCQKLINEGVLRCLPHSLHLSSMEDLIVMIKCIHCILNGTPSASMPAPEHTANSVVSKVLLRVIDHANIHCISIMKDTSLVFNLGEAKDSQTKLYQAAKLALDTISELVKIKHYACALLCPLVVDVSADGAESVLSNPIRQNMIKVIQTSFSDIPVATVENCTSLNDHYILVCQRLVYHACRALISVVEAAHAIQKSNQSRLVHGAEGMLLEDMDGSSVARRIRTLLLTGSQERYESSCQRDPRIVDGQFDIIKSTRIVSIYLLASIARSCSFLISSHWELFLSDSDKTLLSSQKRCKYESFPLLSRISRGTRQYDHEQMVAALSAIEELMRNMPFKQMLTMANVKNKPLNASTINKGHSSGLNSCSVVARMFGAVSFTIDALVDELETSWSRLQSKRGFKEAESITLILGVLQTIITIIPLDNESISSSLNDGIARELSLVFCMFLTLTTSPSLSSASSAIHKAAASVIMSSMGGKVTQSGSLTEIPIPTRLWLQQNTKAIADLFCICCSSVYPQKDESLKFLIIERLDVLQSIFRVAPWILADAEIQSLSTKVILHYLAVTRDHKLRAKGCELFTSLLMGRQDFGSNEESLKIAFSIVNFQIIPAVCYCLKDPHLLVNASAVSALAELSTSDWVFFCQWQDVPISAIQTLFLVIQLCMVKPSGDCLKSKDRKQLSTARAEACKALGKICSSVLGPKMEKCLSETLLDHSKKTRVCSLCNSLYNEGVAALLDSCRDPCAAVRGMAIFAIGNLSLALNQSEEKLVLQSGARHLELCNVALSLLKEDDDKVIGNAIRTISHLIEGLFSLSTYNDSWADENGVIDILGFASEILSERIHLVLLETSGVGVERTWRQRSSAKKHAWGACRGLAAILSNRLASRKCIAKQVEFSIKCLVGCLDQALILHLKIVSSAVSSLRSVSIDVWQNLSGEESVVGMAIKGCVGILSSSEARCRLYCEDILKELNTLLTTLLVLSNWKNYLSLSNKEDTTGNHEFLYFWLVESYHMNSVQKAFIFKSLETALEAEKHPNLLLVQKFACRALKEERKSNSSAENISVVVNAHDGCRSSFHVLDDSEDEL